MALRCRCQVMINSVSLTMSWNSAKEFWGVWWQWGRWPPGVLIKVYLRCSSSVRKHCLTEGEHEEDNRDAPAVEAMGQHCGSHPQTDRTDGRHFKAPEKDATV